MAKYIKYLFCIYFFNLFLHFLLGLSIRKGKDSASKFSDH
jgi:hypothetical protein